MVIDIQVLLPGELSVRVAFGGTLVVIPFGMTAHGVPPSWDHCMPIL
jgi:hypothetical protein